MKTEIESKWLNINHADFRKKLIAAGAINTRPKTDMLRQTFDFPDKRLNNKNGWVRLRQENDKVTLSYKQVDNLSLTGTKEICVTVDSFDGTKDFLESIGLERLTTQETRRESWELDGAEIELDEWPWLPPFIEIETKDEKTMMKTAKKLGLDLADATHGSADYVYATYYDIQINDINFLPELRFSPVPDWLEVKRR